MPKITKEQNKSRSVDSSNSFGDVVSVADAYQDEGLKIGFYGRSGSGKSTASLSLPRPILQIIPSASGRAKPGELKAFKNEKDVFIKFLYDADDLLSVIKSQAATNKFKTINLDYLGEFQNLILKKLLDLDDVPEQLSWGIASMEQWQEVTAMEKEYVNRLLELPCNVGILGQEREQNFDKDSELIIPTVTYEVAPAFAKWLGPRLDNTIHTFVKSDKVQVGTKKIGTKDVAIVEEKARFFIRTGPHQMYYTKIRVPKGTKVPQYIPIGEKDSVYDELKKLGVH